MCRDAGDWVDSCAKINDSEAVVILDGRGRKIEAVGDSGTNH